MSGAATSLTQDPADRHRTIADSFTALVHGVPDWDAPSPVPGWTARDVVGHLVGWLPPFLAEGTPHRLRRVAGGAEDPVAVWRAHAEGVQALLEDADIAASDFRHPQVPAQPLATAIDRFYTVDVFMHSWDLARASRQEVDLDADLCAELLGGMEAMEDVIRASGQFGQRHPVAEGATVQDRLIAFIGRDPDWRPVDDTP